MNEVDGLLEGGEAAAAGLLGGGGVLVSPRMTGVGEENCCRVVEAGSRTIKAGKNHTVDEAKVRQQPAKQA